jgi:excisionase family DNA binding protein
VTLDESEIAVIAARVAAVLAQHKNDGLLDLGTAATRYHVGVSTLRRAIADGKLVASRCGRRWRVSPAALEEWLTPATPTLADGRRSLAARLRARADRRAAGGGK